MLTMHPTVRYSLITTSLLSPSVINWCQQGEYEGSICSSSSCHLFLRTKVSIDAKLIDGPPEKKLERQRKQHHRFEKFQRCPHENEFGEVKLYETLLLVAFRRRTS